MWVSARDQAAPKAGTSAAPIVVRRRRLALPGVLMVAIAAVWCAVAIRGLVVGAPEVIPGLGTTIGAAGTLMVGSALALLGLSWIVRREVLVIDRDMVELADRRLTGVRVWHAPLTGYRGVRDRQEQHPHRYGTRVWYVVELWHPEPEKTVELARTRDPRTVEECAVSWARRLGLPLCRRPDEPLGKPKLGAQDEVALTTDPARPLPAA